MRLRFDGLKAHHDRIWSGDLATTLYAIHEAPWGGKWCGLGGKKQPHKISKGEIGHILRRQWEITSPRLRIPLWTSPGSGATLGESREGTRIWCTRFTISVLQGRSAAIAMPSRLSRICAG